MSERPTPETDANAYSASTFCGSDVRVVHRDLARKLERERDEARVSCAKWRACARSLARVVDYLKPDLRDENDGWSQERMAMRLYDKMEAAK